MNQRQDIQAMRLDAERLAQNLGLTRTTRFINVLELGVVNNRSNEEPTPVSYTHLDVYKRQEPTRAPREI